MMMLLLFLVNFFFLFLLYSSFLVSFVGSYHRDRIRFGFFLM
jgi:hypothetical protein